MLSLPVASTVKEVGSKPRIFSILGFVPLRYSRLKKDFVIVNPLYLFKSVWVNNFITAVEIARDSLIKSKKSAWLIYWLVIKFKC